MFKRILVPLDGSRLAEVVVPLVERLGAARHTEVIHLHVLKRGALAAIHGERHLTSTQDANAYLRGLAEQLRQSAVHPEYHVHEAPEGDVARSIIEQAEEMGADLIVLATQGSGGMRDFLSGSIARQVLNRGTVPVLLARPGR